MYPTKICKPKVTINDVVRIVYFHVCDIGDKPVGMRRKPREIVCGNV